jgi:hypothetical protein
VDAQEDPPKPPPEAELIALARRACGLTIAEAAAKTDVVKASRWGQIENGYVMKSGRAVPAVAGHMQLAHMAKAVKVTPAELRAAGRREAAAILDRVHQGELRGDADDEYLDRLYREWKANRVWRPVLKGFLEARPDPSDTA